MQEISNFTSATQDVELFDDFFESGKEESTSPFLTPKSRKWGRNLRLKSSFISAFFLLVSFTLSFFQNTLPLSNLFLLLTYFFAGIPALISAVEDIYNVKINIDVLMTLAAFLSFLIGSGREGALLLVLFSFSGSMEDAVSSKAKSAIFSLKKISPQKAYVVQADGTLLERSVKDIPIHTKIHVKAGEVVPLDGKVIEGTSALNLVHLTGENLPLTCNVGDVAPAGARNLDGALTIEVTHNSNESTLSRIIKLISVAQESKPKLERWFDKLTNRYAASIIFLSLFFAICLPLLTSIPYVGKEGSIYRSLAFLIAASPCALILAVPIAYLSAISATSRHGVLIKGGTIFDRLAKCKIIALDKTGTLTKGELACFEVKTFGNEKNVLSLAYALERSALHPIAKAISQHAQERNILPAKISDWRLRAGLGLQAKYEGKDIYIGSEKWILPMLSDERRSEIEHEIIKIRERGDVFTILFAEDAVTLFCFHDSLRPKVRETLSSLENKWGLRLLMLTGDHPVSAKKIAEEAGIKKIFAHLSPEEKLDIISKEENLIMVGDGINDAPALTRASVGISMGKIGSGTAIDASDVVLLQDNFEKIEWLIGKSKQVVSIVKQNLILASITILFAGSAALLGFIPLWLSVILHEGGTVIVGLNALRLLKKN